MQIRFLSLLCGLFCLAGLYAQQKNFPLMYSHGKIPADFLVKPEEAAKKKIEAIKAQAKIVSQAEVDYIYVREYTFSHYITEGVITYGDLISSYNNRIVNRLLKNEPELRNKIKVYLLRSDEARLVSFDQGPIFVSTALFSKIENEAQMAYLLAREIIHIRENHAHDYFVSNYLTNTGKTRYEDRVSVFSAEQEAEADKKALRLCLDAGYAIGECVKALDAFSKFDHCFGETKFDIAFFEHDDYVFPDEYQLAQVKTTEADSLALQLFPNLENRIKELRQYIGMFQQTDGVAAFERAEAFLLLQTYAREETIRMYCINQKPEHAIYGAYVILKSDSTNTSAKRIMSYCMAVKAIYESPDKTTYSMAVIVISRNKEFVQYAEKNTSESETEKKHYSGETARVSHFLSSMSNAELAILALDINWNFYISSPGEADAFERAKILMNILNANYSLNTDVFSNTNFLATVKEAKENTPAVQKNTKDNNRPIIAPEPLQSKDAWGTYIKTQEDSIDKRLEGYSAENPGEEQNTTTRLKAALKLVIWRKADPQKQYETILYNYYEYAFVKFMNDPSFLETFSKAPNEILMEKTYRSYKPTVENELSHNTGLGKEKFMPGFLYCVSRVYDINAGKLFFNDKESEELRGYQKNAVYSYSYNYANSAFYSVLSLTENDSFAYSYFCIYQTILADTYNHLSENRSIAPGACGDLRYKVALFFKTNIILSSYIINQSYLSKKPSSKFITIGTDINTGRTVLYWYEEHGILATNYLIIRHYNNVRRKIINLTS